MHACGHMYLDGGEELSTGTAVDNFLAFGASMTADVSGFTGQVLQQHCLGSVCAQGLLDDERASTSVIICLPGGSPAFFVMLTLHALIQPTKSSC